VSSPTVQAKGEGKSVMCSAVGGGQSLSSNMSHDVSSTKAPSHVTGREDRQGMMHVIFTISLFHFILDILYQYMPKTGKPQ
jgi:hypothetical protein